MTAEELSGAQVAFGCMAGRVLSAILLGCILFGPATGQAEGFLIGYVGRWRVEDAAMAALLEADTVREYLGWASVEEAGGKPRLPPERVAQLQDLQGKRIVPLVCFTGGHPDYDSSDYLKSEGAIKAYAAALAAVAREAGNLVPLWQIWNEWNLNYAAGVKSKDEYGSPEDYVRVLKAAYAAVHEARRGDEAMRGSGEIEESKEAEKDAAMRDKRGPLVIGGNMALDGAKHEWLIRACRAGMLEHLDGLGFQPYWYWGEDRLPERGLLRRMARVENTIRPFEERLGKTVPFYVTEWGWPTASGQDDAVTLEEQAKYIARSMLLLRANPRVRGVWLYELRDVSENLLDTDHNFGLLYHDGTPKPSFAAFRDASGIARRAVSAEVMQEVVDESGGDVWAVRLVREDGSIDLAIWAVEPGKWEAKIRGPNAGGNMAALLIGTGVEAPLPGASDAPMVVTFHDMPLVVRGLSPNAEIESVINLQ